MLFVWRKYKMGYACEIRKSHLLSLDQIFVTNIVVIYIITWKWWFAFSILKQILEIHHGTQRSALTLNKRV